MWNTKVFGTCSYDDAEKHAHELYKTLTIHSKVAVNKIKIAVM